VWICVRSSMPALIAAAVIPVVKENSPIWSVELFVEVEFTVTEPIEYSYGNCIV